MSPEYLGLHFQEGLMEAGAIDFSLIQQLMKKGRLGFLLRVLLPEKQLTSVANYLFQQTSTIGVRYHRVERQELDRTIKDFRTPYGKIRVKESHLKDRAIKRKPEYDDIQRLAQEQGISPWQLFSDLNINLSHPSEED